MRFGRGEPLAPVGRNGIDKFGSLERYLDPAVGGTESVVTPPGSEPMPANNAVPNRPSFKNQSAPSRLTL